MGSWLIWGELTYQAVGMFVEAAAPRRGMELGSRLAG